MIKIILTLVKIRLRRFLPINDSFALVLFFLFYITFYYYISNYFLKFKWYFLIISSEILFYNMNRKDLDLLKVNKNNFYILLIEYIVYSLPCFIIFTINKKFDVLIVYVLLIVGYLFIPKHNFKTINLPFNLICPYWHINFRKYKLIVPLVLCVFLVFMSKESGNDNLIFLSIIIIGHISSLQYFNRETMLQIQANSLNPKQYLDKQLFSSYKNTLILISPILLILVILQMWSFIIYFTLVFVFTGYNVLCKYVFFENNFIQKLIFYLSVGPLVLVLFPIFYYKSIKNICFLKDA